MLGKCLALFLLLLASVAGGRPLPRTNSSQRLDEAAFPRFSSHGLIDLSSAGAAGDAAQDVSVFKWLTCNLKQGADARTYEQKTVEVVNTALHEEPSMLQNDFMKDSVQAGTYFMYQHFVNKVAETHHLESEYFKTWSAQVQAKFCNSAAIVATLKTVGTAGFAEKREGKKKPLTNVNFALHVEYEILPGRCVSDSNDSVSCSEEFVKITQDLIDTARKKTSLQANLMQQVDDANGPSQYHYHLYHVFENQANLDAHWTSLHVTQWQSGRNKVLKENAKITDARSKSHALVGLVSSGMSRCFPLKHGVLFVLLAQGLLGLSGH